jgi:hypothetical protein
MANFNTSATVTGLGSPIYSVTVPTADTYVIQASLTLPTTVTSGSPSAVVIVVKHNSTTVYTGAPGDEGFSLGGIQCAASDTLSVNLTSANSNDNQLNAVKMSVQVWEGGY